MRKQLIRKLDDPTKLLGLAPKLETLKIEMDKVKEKLLLLASYYKSQNDSTYAKKIVDEANIKINVIVKDKDALVRLARKGQKE